MFCPNCGQAVEEGAAVCANCGAPLLSPEKEPSSPVAFTPELEPMPPAPMPSSSGMAKASLWMGISSVLLIVLAVVVLVAAGFYLADQATGTDLDRFTRATTPEDIERLLADSDIQELVGAFGVASFGSIGCCFLGVLAALLGVIFGIIGISQERDQPTQSGRTHSIVGIVLGGLPLLCCVGFFVWYLIVAAGPSIRPLG